MESGMANVHTWLSGPGFLDIFFLSSAGLYFCPDDQTPRIYLGRSRRAFRCTDCDTVILGSGEALPQAAETRSAKSET
jgi:hypothetical protein